MISAWDFKAQMQAYPEIALQLLPVIAKRLRHTQNRTLFMSAPLSKKPIQFQKKALEHAHKNLDLDEALQVICPKNWLLVLIIFTLIILFIIWLVWAKIYLCTSGKEILLSTYNTTITLQAPPLEGSFIEKIYVEPGQRINKNMKVMAINNEIAARLKYQEIYLQQIKRQYDLLSAQAKEAIQNLEASEGEQIK